MYKTVTITGQKHIFRVEHCPSKPSELHFPPIRVIFVTYRSVMGHLIKVHLNSNRIYSITDAASQSLTWTVAHAEISCTDTLWHLIFALVNQLKPCAVSAQGWGRPVLITCHLGQEWCTASCQWNRECIAQHIALLV